jgi:hypothetical protein
VLYKFFKKMENGMMFYRCLLGLIAFVFCSSALAGELIYRTTTYGVTEIGLGCSWKLNHGELKSDTLICNGAPILNRNFIQLGKAKGCILLLTNTADAVNLDYFNNLGIASVGQGIYRCDGVLSRKTANNVFTKRPLDKNYLAFSNDGVLDKPVILVEGYDPDNNTNPYYYYNYGFNQLVSDGRDLIVINFPDSTLNMSANASLVESIIKEINAGKTGAFPTALVGFSMGGVVARKALKNMELAGVNHNTSVYVSFDAPHMGANTPLPLQETVDDLISEVDSKTAGYTSSGLKRARNVYNSAAAREMLIAGPEFRSAVPSDFPNNLVRVTVTSGGLLGTSSMQANSTYEGEYIAGFRFYLYKSDLGSWSESYDWYSKKRGALYYDNVPGSYEESFYRAYIELKNSADHFGVRTEARRQNITFVPTFSALAISAQPTAELRSLFRQKSPFDRYIAVDDSGLSPCQSFAAQDASGRNLVHAPLSESFNNNQLMQLNCALNEYQRNNFSIPDRSFKAY